MPMSDALVGVIIFGLLFGGALFGMLLAWALPTQHLSTESRDVIRVVMAMLATLSAVVLGLLTGAAINSLAEKEGELRRAGVQFIMLDRTLADYGPETDAARGLLKQTLADRISQIWPADGGDVILDALGGGPGIRLVQKEIFALTPATDEQRWLQANALQYAKSIAESRWTTVEQISSRFPWAFFLTVVGWLAIIFISFGLFAPRNGSVVAAFFLASISLAGAIFMILEMDQPYGGAVRIPSTALTVALEQLGGS
jgi:hypothetical protein